MNNFRLERIKKDLKQEDIAYVLHINVATYGKKERREVPFIDKELETLADFYNVTIDYLLGR